ncbi:hypothetical protein PF005_g19442 [Phytophthora fragariae]|nr:hypothetical protein PF009_g20237 [Phytophthora fragariae]KAE8991698.1 hypothetical protein PF011_g17847 [Phytophthora fragariae]KAE9070898.1 hypothetical protein PF006_g29262 [Phytophthora fragariae]KAE9166515.1 hypothetical protein PF004_g29131 [Phytophthora fragariae]KAE9189967.1 hypothetical protein PF005_g19442 [Phytophthora fragariae]
MELGPGELNSAGNESSQSPNAAGLEPEAATPSEHKFGLSFILSSVPVRRRSQSALAETVVVAPAGRGKKAKRITKKEDAGLSKEEKKRRRRCKHEGCHNYIAHKGLCCRHGGGKKCTREGCSSSAKHRGLCWKHGGSVKCREDGCDKKAKARGLCWAHGGGTKCRNTVFQATYCDLCRAVNREEMNEDSRNLTHAYRWK